MQLRILSGVVDLATIRTKLIDIEAIDIIFIINKTPVKAFTPPVEKKKGHKVVFRQKSKRVTGLYNT